MSFGRKKPSHRATDIESDVEDCQRGDGDDYDTDKYDYEHPIDEAYFRLLTKQDGVPSEVTEAYILYRNLYKKEVVEAFYIAGGDKQDINEIFDINPDILDVYRRLFFDADVFKDRLDLHQYVYNYEDKLQGYGEELKENALKSGLTYMKASFGDSSYSVPQVKALKETIKQSYLLSKSARRNGIESKAGQEARKWASTMLDAMEAMPEVREHQNEKEQDLAIQLFGEDNTNKRDLSDAEIISSPEDVADED